MEITARLHIPKYPQAILDKAAIAFGMITAAVAALDDTSVTVTDYQPGSCGITCHPWYTFYLTRSYSYR